VGGPPPGTNTINGSRDQRIFGCVFLCPIVRKVDSVPLAARMPDGGRRRSGADDGRVAVAKFEYDSSRPVDGYAAPQLHTHAVIFNITETADGNVRALQPQELYKTQQYAKAVYRSELALHLQRIRPLGSALSKSGLGRRVTTLPLLLKSSPLTDSFKPRAPAAVEKGL
jgi:hypothetical protein